jgi:tetratricopeptide (TPR) repeat protein
MKNVFTRQKLPADRREINCRLREKAATPLVIPIASQQAHQPLIAGFLALLGRPAQWPGSHAACYEENQRCSARHRPEPFLRMQTEADFLGQEIRPRAGRLAATGYVWIFLGALLLRAIYLTQALAHNELLTHPMVDAAVYVQWARDILTGKWLWYDAMNYTPGVPAWLAFWIGLTGWHPALHFAIFHLLGAMQAVLIGKTAELVWTRRAGLVTAVLAATYWPWVIYEASYYAEPFAIFNLALSLWLVVRWLKRGGSVAWLAWAGFHLGWSILARANAIACLPLIAGWVAWRVFRDGKIGPRLIAPVAAVVLPSALLLAPIAAWNCKLTGRPVLRTMGWLNVHLGNNPEFQLLAVPAGVRWDDFVYRPIRAERIKPVEQEEYWRSETIRVIKARPVDWLKLQWHKALMLAGRFEVSQEVDIAAFRSASSILNLSVWPGWGTVAPLALLAAMGVFFSRDARRGLPLLLCGLAYFASILPVHIAARYRMPVVVMLLPLAGWALMCLVEKLRERDWPLLAPATAALLCAGALVWPDWLRLGERKIINDSFLIGIKRAQQGDHNGALAAFGKGAAWNPADPDCPLRLGQIWLQRGDIKRARALFEKSLVNFSRGHDAHIGLGECASAEHNAGESLQQARLAMEIAPNNMEALGLASRAFMALGDWRAMARVCRQMRSYPTHPASVSFTEAWAWLRAGNPAEALAIYDSVAETVWFSPLQRARASFLGGALAWRLDHDKATAARRWGKVLDASPTFFSPLARMLLSDAAPLPALEHLDGQSRQYADYAMALAATLKGDPAEATRFREAVLATRNARALGPADQNVLEIWSLEDSRSADLSRN